MRRFLDDDARRHCPAERRRLLSLVGDVAAGRRELKPSERIRLGSISPLKDETHAAWSISVDPDDARAAFARLADQ